MSYMKFIFVIFFNISNASSLFIYNRLLIGEILPHIIYISIHIIASFSILSNRNFINLASIAMHPAVGLSALQCRKIALPLPGIFLGFVFISIAYSYCFGYSIKCSLLFQSFFTFVMSISRL